MGQAQGTTLPHTPTLPIMSQIIRIDSYNKSEWARLSADCIKHGRKDKGAWFHKLATSDADSLPIATYDQAQRYYRQWLVFGFPKD